MTTINLNMQAAHARAIGQFGQAITVQRLTGEAPNVTALSAVVTAIVKNMPPETAAPTQAGYSSSALGGITQTDRMVIVMASDLAAAGFPVPVQKNDKIILSTTGEKLDVSRVDGEKRSQAGAIELYAAGVQ
jgi:hypothetical protein